MYKILRMVVIMILPIIAMTCATVPGTGRKQLNFMSGGKMASMGTESYKSVISQSKLSTDQEKTAMIKRCGQKIAVVAEEFLRSIGKGDDIQYYKWEYNLIDDDNTVNAWAMPGGKIAFYTGILKLTASEDEVAVIMGHEIAHVIANHGNERMSQQKVVETGGMILDTVLQTKSTSSKKTFMAAFGLGSSVGVLLPFSRKHEYEADEIGLKLMYKAGYKPQASVDFWQKMAAMGKSKVPEFLSTHPASQERVDRLKQLITTLK